MQRHGPAVGTMKKLAIILIVLIVLGGAGGAGYWFFLREPPDEESAEAAEEKHSLVETTRFIELDPIILPVIREGQVTLHVTTTISIELAKPIDTAQAHMSRIRLTDTVLSELHGIYGLRYVQERGYDLPIVRDRLRLASERVLGVGTVKSVVLLSVNKRALYTG